MSFGQIDQAQEIYEQVSSSDPKNSIAVVGLARVALERGDELGAYLLARRALSIDPENDAARRMAVRLEEVLATRGQPVDDPLPAGAGEPVTSTAPAPAPAPELAAPAPELAAPAPEAAMPAAPPPDGPPPPESAAHIPRPTAAPKPKRRSLLGRLRRR